MPLRRTFRALSLFAALSVLPGHATFAAGLQNRILQAIPTDSSAPQVTIPHVVPAEVSRAQDAGPLPSGRTLSAVTLRFSLSPAQDAALDRLLADLQDPHSPRFHQWLTPEQFGASFGLSDADLSQVTTWAKSQGLTVSETARGRNFVVLSGSAAQVERAFHVSLHTFTLEGETHFASVNDPALPASLASVVSTVTGLHDFRLKPHVHAHFTSAISGNHFIAPGDFYTIYDLNPLLASSINGAGQTIAVMGQTDISLGDVAAFRAASGLAANNPTVKLYGTDPGVSTADLDEAQLDVEWSGAVAPGATILYINSSDVFGGSLSQAINNNVAPILTISYGDCEANIGASNLATYNNLFRQANAQGQTIVGPSGDSGATDCDYQVSVASGGLAVDFPASSPSVTAVGGTMFNEGSGTYFTANNGNYSGSATSYIPEAAWNETASSSSLASGGGGVSGYFAKPLYQQGLGVPADGLRDVPDLSFTAAASHDGYLFCSKGFCTNGYRNATSNLDVVGGTSVSTPAFAGVLALIEQKIGSKIGNANPTIYALANSTYSTAVFHDITSGNNNSPCVTGSTNCASGGTIGYSAGVGYDLATGWGSVDAFNMVSDWNQVAPLGVSAGQNTSVTTLASSANGGVAGVSLTLTATVASGATGVSTLPTGTVQFLVDGVSTGATVTLSAGKATYVLSTSALSSGSHLIAAAYSGDSVYASSTGTYTIDITSATSGDYTISPSATTVTVATGTTSAPVTLTLTSLNAFAGAITFNATSNTTGNVGLNLTVNPVTLSANGTATTVLTFTAFRSLNTAPASSLLSRTSQLRLGAGGLSLACLMILAVPGRRRRRVPILLAGLVSVGMLGTLGCSSSAAAPPAQVNASPGTYSFVLSASGTGAPTHSVTVNFVVQ